MGLLAEAGGDREGAERYLQDALQQNEQGGGRPWLALTQHACAQMLLGRRGPGDRKRAMGLLQDSLALARQLGMKGLEAKIERLLQTYAGSVPRFPDGLTRREVEVLRLVASGMSNREISAALVLSLRTAARHVTNIYAKIGARNRADATAYAIRHNLIAP
jgi:ATP/maltotriose-dependent transcriptional regulator MalT